MTNATDELSRLLEERGVEYTTDDSWRAWSPWPSPSRSCWCPCGGGADEGCA